MYCVLALTTIPSFRTLRQLLLCVLLPVLAKASNICYNSTEAGIQCTVHVCDKQCFVLFLFSAQYMCVISNVLCCFYLVHSTCV